MESYKQSKVVKQCWLVSQCMAIVVAIFMTAETGHKLASKKKKKKKMFHLIGLYQFSLNDLMTRYWDVQLLG